MNQERVFQILLGPHVSEKSAGSTSRKYRDFCRAPLERHEI